MLVVLAQLALLARLLASSAWRRHKFLFCLACFSSAAIAAGNVGYGLLSTSNYARLWLTNYLAICSLVALALTEACTLSLERYDRFGEVGRRIIRAILIASSLMIFAALFVLPSATAKSFWSYLQAQAYLIQGSLALLGLSVLAFARWARLRLSRNARMTIVVLTLLCAVDGLLGSGISGSWGSFSFTFGILWSAGCWLYLALRWSPQPEPAPVANPAADRAMIAPELARMAALNRGLVELVRRQ